jgi:DNA-3-methyladenine glycosylase I
LEGGLITGADGRPRCWWCGHDAEYSAYHDDEWGRPVYDDCRLFEKICLEGFQAGLSWLTILRKRDNFRHAFAGFDYHRIARFNKRSVDRLLKDAGIVRHRAKIESTINNAKRAIEIEEEIGSLSEFFWRYVPPPSERPRRMTRTAIGRLGTTSTSLALSKELKRRGWTFVGPTTAYAFMQAMGLVNDHLEGCFVRDRIAHPRGV